MSRNTSRQGGATSYKEGVLKRPLQEVHLFTMGFSGGDPTPGPFTQRLQLQGLSPNLSVVIAIGLCGQGNRDQPTYPPLPGKAKVLPFTQMTSGQTLYQKPLNLAPQTLPAAFALAPGMRIGEDGANPAYGTNMCDGVVIEVTVDGTQYDGTEIQGSVVCAATAHYTGPWWDIDAIENLMGYLNLSSADPVFIKTGGL